MPLQDVGDLLSAIAACTDRLIAALDDEHPGLPDAHELRRLVSTAVRITRLRRAMDNHAAALAEPARLPSPSADVTTSDRAAVDGPLVASVLVVEDEPRIRELIRTLLTRAGHDVVAVAGPHEALAVLHRRPSIELLVIDVIMPDMTGYDLADQARARAPGVRVVFTSGFRCDVARHPPGDGFLAKPFTSDALNEVVQQALRHS